MFNKGLLKYTFNTICNENKDIVLEDGLTKVFVNATYNGNDTKSDGIEEDNIRLRSLIKYINT